MLSRNCAHSNHFQSKQVTLADSMRGNGPSQMIAVDQSDAMTSNMSIITMEANVSTVRALFVSFAALGSCEQRPEQLEWSVREFIVVVVVSNVTRVCWLFGRWQRVRGHERRPLTTEKRERDVHATMTQLVLVVDVKPIGVLLNRHICS
jgi:hypothetical protein